MSCHATTRSCGTPQYINIIVLPDFPYPAIVMHCLALFVGRWMYRTENVTTYDRIDIATCTNIQGVIGNRRGELVVSVVRILLLAGYYTSIPTHAAIVDDVTTDLRRFFRWSTRRDRPATATAR
ncbi:hypothetical protein QTP88_008320 [Uroleucon formosanum]